MQFNLIFTMTNNIARWFAASINIFCFMGSFFSKSRGSLEARFNFWMGL